MGATTAAAFDPKPKYLGEVVTCKATAAILAGQWVSFDASGEDRYVSPGTTSLGSVVGVALHTQSTVGGAVAVASNGSVVLSYVDQDDGTADAGDYMAISAVAGFVKVMDAAVAAHDSEGAGIFPCGQILEDLAATEKKYVRVLCSPIWTAQS